MAKKLNWEKLRYDRRPKLSISDEGEFRTHDVAARWLEGAERWQLIAQRIRARKKARKEQRRKRK